MRAMNFFVGYKLRKDLDNKYVTWKKGTRGICKLSYFNSDDMHPLHLFLTKKEAEAWLMKLKNTKVMALDQFFSKSFMRRRFGTH